MKKIRFHCHRHGFTPDEDPGTHKVQTVKAAVLCIAASLEDINPHTVRNAMEKYLDVVDCFYEDFGHLLAPQQYQRAREDMGYFLQLVDVTMGREQTGGVMSM